MVVNGKLLSLVIREGIAAATGKPYSIPSARVSDPDYREPYWVTLGQEVTPQIVEAYQSGAYGHEPSVRIIIRAHTAKADKAYLRGNLVTINDQPLTSLTSPTSPISGETAPKPKFQ